MSENSKTASRTYYYDTVQAGVRASAAAVAAAAPPPRSLALRPLLLLLQAAAHRLLRSRQAASSRRPTTHDLARDASPMVAIAPAPPFAAFLPPCCSGFLLLQ